MLETIYIVRHGFRSNWVVNQATGQYTANVPSPTGIPSDPALAGYGVIQSKELGEYLTNVKPPIDLIYSSPFYRCLQTISPFVNARAERDGKDKVTVHIENGLGDFYGLARFTHPSPAPIEVLNQHFPHLQAEKQAIIVPSSNGEDIPQLHDRIAYCLDKIIARADTDPAQPKTLLICSHAATMIAMGRALTGRMPENLEEEDFKCFTCSLSKYVRRDRHPGRESEIKEKPLWNPETPAQIPDVGWRGKGLKGGWDCLQNGDCSFLSGGEERGWIFGME